MKNPVSLLRFASLAEAVSYLLLLGIAMPLKYIADIPLAVRIAGSLHGGLFILLCIALALALLRARFPLSRAALIFGASFIPLLPFFLDRRIRAWQAARITG